MWERHDAYGEYTPQAIRKANKNLSRQMIIGDRHYEP
jgi:hypothetical protein